MDPLFLLPLIFIFSLLILLKLAKRRPLHLPPSPPKLPIIGNIHQLGKLPHRSFRQLSRNYGSLLLLQLGSNPTLVVSSAEMVREIVKNHDIAFSDKPKTTAVKEMFYDAKGLGFSPYGEFWRQVKKMSVVELLSNRRVHSFQFVRDEEVDHLVDKIRRACQRGETVVLSDMLTSVSSNIVSRCVLSHESENEDGCSRFGHLAKNIMNLIINTFCIGDIFPYLWWLDVLTGYIPRMKSLSKELDEFLDEVIEEHRALENHEQVTSKKDFVSIIMQLQKDGMLEMDLTQDNIKAILMDLFVAGTDTTITTDEWAMTELLKNENAMKKVQIEVRTVVGNKSKVDPEDINKMEYLKCVIKETLRLHPPNIIRKLSAPVKLGGYDIPSGTNVMVNSWAIHRDPERWERPEEFTPERFENNPIDFQGQDFHYIPFGFGRRACPGMLFGVASVEYVIANLLYWFDWKLPAGETAENFDMTELYGLTITRKNPLCVVPVPRSSF
ncbi:FUS3-complementing protein 2 isoform 1 [Hibiscus syriacus]|uniref:FUS3-complementing protein 2 isoform 1 n=1 Tax=Hibiscus syriacus TaxID=106335 RepID=A0A6A2YVK8_HIBSY|nr:cytochrome P450 71A1-like [Hibiscus syriacus]KAE8683085.1 FUS3-complementing protein 2 isoform 1 [Hibiscus syriacus]